MKSFKSRQDWKTPKIDIAPIRIRYRVTGALVSSGNYTHFEILTGNSWEKFINYKVFRRESNLLSTVPG